ncbi:MAG: DoxX family protein [Maribacter sp.]
MYYILIAAKVIIFISIINVWFFRFNKETPYRGGGASSMKAEFATYGLPEIMVYIVGTLKVLSAIGILASIWYPQLATPAAGIMAILMIGAIIMHFKVKDDFKKSLPAASFLLLSLLIIAFS